MDVIDLHSSCRRVCTLVVFVISCSGESGRAMLLRLKIGTNEDKGDIIYVPRRYR